MPEDEAEDLFEDDGEEDDLLLGVDDDEDVCEECGLDAEDCVCDDDEDEE